MKQLYRVNSLCGFRIAVVWAIITVCFVGLQTPENGFAQERDGRRAAEGEGRRPAAERGPRRSAEGEAGPRRSAEGERGARRPAEGEGRGDLESAIRNFKPQTQREAALFQTILMLRKELLSLRKEMQGRSGDGEGVGQRDPRDGEGLRAGGERDRPPTLRPGWEKTKAGQVFNTYDKNGDKVVTLDEWLEMTNGNATAARRKVQTERFEQAGPGRDGRLSPAEFIHWYNRREGAPKARRDGEGGRSAEGEAGPRRPAEGEGRRSPEAEAGARRPAEGEGKRPAERGRDGNRRQAEF